MNEITPEILTGSVPADRSGAARALFVLIPAVVFLILALAWTMRVKKQGEARERAGWKSAAISGHLDRNRLLLTQYMLSGDTRYVEVLNSSEESLHHSLTTEMAATGSEDKREALRRVIDLEQDWEQRFAKPMIEARQKVDHGDSTVALLQISYLQLDPPSWDDRFNLVEVDLQVKSIDAPY